MTPIRTTTVRRTPESARPPAAEVSTAAALPAALAEIATDAGPFCTAYLRAGPMIGELFDELVGERTDACVTTARGALVDHLDHPGELPPVSVAVVAGAERAMVASFDLPVRDDMLRVGPVTSLGTWLEFLQSTPVHLVVTVDGDGAVLHEIRPAVTSAEAVTLASGALADIASAVRFRHAELLTVVADPARHDELGTTFSSMAGTMGLDLVDASRPIDDLADELVRLADTARARRVAGALRAYREADRFGLTRAEGAAVRTIRRGEAVQLLVHDDPEDTRSTGGRRLVDDAVHAALTAGVDVVMIPATAEPSGPVGGLGVVLAT